VRFFGKFFGTHADYYVFETTLKSPPEEPEQQLGEWGMAVVCCKFTTAIQPCPQLYSWPGIACRVSHAQELLAANAAPDSIRQGAGMLP
jgi:hypothetical protein